MRALLEGFTKRAEEPVCEELEWLLHGVRAEGRKPFEEGLSLIKEKNPVVYALLLMRNTETDGSWQQKIFQESTSSFSRMAGYVGRLEKAEISPAMKDQLIRAGIGLLNQDLFKKQNYMQFDALMLRLARKEQWVEILKEFVTDQLAPEAENLTDEELKTACYVEQLLKKYEPLGTAGVLAKERKRRKKTGAAGGDCRRRRTGGRLRGPRRRCMGRTTAGTFKGDADCRMSAGISHRMRPLSV